MNRTSTFHCAVQLLAVVLWAAACRADEAWPQFRGPRGDGVSTATGLPLVWGEGRNLRWKTDLSGRGRSSPVVLGDRVWVTTGDDVPSPPEQRMARLRDLPEPGEMSVAADVQLRVVCLDRRSGKLLYDVELFHLDKPEPIHRLNSFATPTPAAEPGRVYCDFGTFGTACIEAETGRMLWKAHLPAEHTLGPGSSPVLADNLLLLVRDGVDVQYVAALDKRTGRTAWKTDRPPIDTESRFEKKSFSTPLLIEHAGRRQAIVPGAHWVCSYDPAGGKELWRVRHGRGYSIAPRPVFGHGMVFICTGGYHADLMAIRVDGLGDVTASHVVWKASGPIPLMSSPVLVGDELYCVSDNGVASCFDARNGKLHWRDRIGGTHLASPLAAEGRLYFFDQEGKATVLRVGKEFVRLAESRLEGPLAAAPAVAGGAVFLRADRRLYCLGEPR